MRDWFLSLYCRQTVYSSSLHASARTWTWSCPRSCNSCSVACAMPSWRRRRRCRRSRGPSCNWSNSTPPIGSCRRRRWFTTTPRIRIPSDPSGTCGPFPSRVRAICAKVRVLTDTLSICNGTKCFLTSASMPLDATVNARTKVRHRWYLFFSIYLFSFHDNHERFAMISFLPRNGSFVRWFCMQTMVYE